MDISPELLKLIQEAYAKGKDESEVLAEIMAKVGAGTATYSEANDYAVELGRIMAEAFGQNLSSKVLPQGKMYWNIGDKVIRPTVTQGYEDVADVAELVQTGLNEAASIHIKAQRPQIDQGRIDRMIGDLMGLPDYDSGSQGFLNAVQNLLHSSVDDSIRTNAEFHYKAGLKPKIVRTLSGKCCEWCTAIAGSYTYPDVPRDVYKRHDNCRCKVDYKTADGKTQSVHSGTEGRRKYVQVKNDPREHYELSKAERIRHAKEMEATEDARKEAARQKRIETWKRKKTRGMVTKGINPSIIKSIDVDDFRLMISTTEIKSDVADFIVDTIKEHENNGEFWFVDVHYGSFIDEKTGRKALFQVVPNFYGGLELNINSDVLGGKTLEDINKMINNTNNNIAQTLEEALIHECGHAKTFRNRSLAEIKSIIAELENIGVEGISEIALADGAECIAEVEILLHRGESVPKEAMELYRKYVLKEAM